MAGKISDGDIDALSFYRTLAPYAEQNHPADEHMLPLFVSLGAAGDIST